MGHGQWPRVPEGAYPPCPHQETVTKKDEKGGNRSRFSFQEKAKTTGPKPDVLLGDLEQEKELIRQQPGKCACRGAADGRVLHLSVIWTN